MNASFTLLLHVALASVIHEAASILQEKAEQHTLMAGYYFEDLLNCTGSEVTYRQYHSDYCIQHQAAAARASAAARALMGI